MTSVGPAPSLTLQAPGPGTWTLDAVHFPRPMTRYWAELHPEPFRRGFRELTAYYGMLLDYREMAYVEGFGYAASHPVADHEFPQRLQRAAEVFERKLWREQLRDWDTKFKPASIKAHRELQSVDPDALSDAELVEYLARCRDHHAEMIFQHMRFTAAAVLPTGDLLAHAMDWTGVPVSELLGMLRGAAPVSAGASAELERLVAAVRSDQSARDLLELDVDAGEVLQALRALAGETGAAVTAYLDLVGYRLLDGFDISSA